MSSNLKVNTILPSTGTTIGIGTVGGLINVVGNIDVNSTSGISTFNGLEISGIVTAKAGAAVTYYGDGSNLTSLPAQATIANNADNRIITGGSGVNLNGEANLVFNGTKLGVNQNSPYSELDVTSSVEDSTGTLAAHGIRLGAVGATDEQVIPITAGFKSQQDRARAGIGFISKISGSSEGYAGAIGFYTKSAADGSGLLRTNERLRITSAGLVGIATNAPSAAWLDIATNSGSYDHLRMRRLSSDSNIASNWSLKPYGGNLYFRTGGSTDKIYFDDSGDLNIMDGNLIVASGHGIDFAATSDSSGTNASELLDDYEEGSFTPRLAPSSSYASIHENGIGRYTKIGNMVTCTMHWINKNGTAFPTGEQIMIYNLPYTIIHTGNNGDAHYVAMSQMMHNVQFGQQHKHYFYSNHNNTTIRGLKSRDGLSWEIWTCADWNQASLYFDTSITYMTTS